MIDTPEPFEEFKVFLPPYLSAVDRKILFDDLSKFPNISNFYLQDSPDEFLQGDGWTGFAVVDVDSERSGVVEGLILSNSCDIDPRNERALAPRLLFAPLIRMATLEDLLRREKRTEGQISDYLASIRKQYVTNAFFLPAGPYGPTESVAYLDDVRPVRLHEFLELGGKGRVFRLGMAGFYILLLKLSIHFSRLQEGVRRYPAKDG